MNSDRFSWRSLCLWAAAGLTLTTGCVSLIGQDFTTKIDERDTNKDGRADKRLISMWRDKQLVVQRFEIFDHRAGNTNYWGEQVFFEGKILLTLIYTPRGTERTFLPTSGAGIGEQDRDKDGKPDVVSIMDRNGNLHDAAERTARGFLEPVSKSRLKEVRATLAEAEKSIHGLLKGDSLPTDDKKK